MSHVPDYEEKYHDKLLQRAKEQGLRTVEELKQKIKEDEIKKAPQGDSKSSGEPSVRVQDGDARKLNRRSNLSSNNLPPNVKSLDEIMKIDLLSTKSTEEIGEIWNQYHGTKDMISAAIPARTYKDLLKTASKNPLFVIPLPREEGVEFFFMQFDYHQVHFTSLIEYKTNTVNARPYLTLTHYTDLIDDKEVVLMRGELEGERKLIDVQNAQYLALQMQQFYVTGGPEKRALLEKFNQQPEKFDYQELIEAAQKLQ
ncbi:ATP11-domain-containing protein [Martensiomyces pterosporus]|nr:ATP11-domain-containing protein [Martensiomyces pterosporus]